MTVFGPLLHIKNGNLPRGVRKVEMQLSAQDFEHLRATIPAYSRQSLLDSLRSAVSLYRALRRELFTSAVVTHDMAEAKVMQYFADVEAG